MKLPRTTTLLGSVIAMALGTMVLFATVNAESCVRCYWDPHVMGTFDYWCGPSDPEGGFRKCTLQEICDEWFCEPDECCPHCLSEGECGTSLAAPAISPTGRLVTLPQFRPYFEAGAIIDSCTGFIVEGSIGRFGAGLVRIAI
jgi:hypothetical protein